MWHQKYIYKVLRTYYHRCCGSRIASRILDPGSWILDLRSRISYPRSNKSNKRGGKICCHIFFCSHNNPIITKFKFILLWTGKEKNLSQFTKNFSTTFYPKFVTQLSKIGFKIRDLGSRGQKGTGSRIHNIDY